MLERSPQSNSKQMELQLTLWSEGFLVKTCHVQESKQDSKVNEVDCGLKCYESSAKSDHDGSLLKMFEAQLISHLTLAGWDWKEKVTKSGLTSYLLLQQVRLTKENACLLWPTATSEYSGVSTYEGWQRRQQESKHNVQFGLHHAVDKAQNWTTPATRDYKGARKEETFAKTGRCADTNSLPDAIRESAQKGQLNADWVELLMGYGIGYTDTEVDEPKEWQGWPAGLINREWMTPKSVNGGTTTGRPRERSTHLQTQVDCINLQTGQYPYEPPRVITGQKNRAKRLKCLGNSVVPQQAYPIFKAIMEVKSDSR
jgi:site-specific DNA-cytosine methylase